MPMEAMDCLQFILEVTRHSEYFKSNESNQQFVLSHHQYLCTHQYSGKSGGGGGSGGAISFSACTLTASSSVKIEAKGGNGGRARNSGTNLLCHILAMFVWFYYQSYIRIYFLTQDMVVVEVVEESTGTRQQLSIMMTV